MSQLSDAQRWWEDLPERRKIQLWQWIVSPGESHIVLPGQLSLLEDNEDNE
ncbi:hypothetical protein M3B03_04720 [Corynebacterium pseudodiphtheriticum]|uniref:hypothetical protein n=1 Tax=Corynebacterium pseudodiphtheriticum TaxID=37637 RepID=UPI00223C4D4F|nr:hypothetical protein [Corynebacterium pseudodiphtheriticum]MCT1635005.1 hypothetical protein [Corynebacterium pseudodiphtheriticum]MCT1666098.1 hypothetical protein [Corynebacterium pseudodiphtheriticum]